MRPLAVLGYGGVGKWGDQRPGEFVSSWEGQPEAALAKRGSQTPLEWIAREIRCITVEGKNSRLGLGLCSLTNTGGSRATTERGRSTHSPEFSIWTTSRSPCPLCEVYARISQQNGVSRSHSSLVWTRRAALPVVLHAGRLLRA